MVAHSDAPKSCHKSYPIDISHVNKQSYEQYRSYCPHVRSDCTLMNRNIIAPCPLCPDNYRDGGYFTNFVFSRSSGFVIRKIYYTFPKIYFSNFKSRDYKSRPAGSNHFNDKYANFAASFK